LSQFIIDDFYLRNEITALLISHQNPDVREMSRLAANVATTRLYISQTEDDANTLPAVGRPAVACNAASPGPADTRAVNIAHCLGLILGNAVSNANT